MNEPLYLQLVEELKNQIENELQPNDKMLSEREITQKYSVSRTTVRMALNHLEMIGYIYRQHGKGTFVSELMYQHNTSDDFSFLHKDNVVDKQNIHMEILSFNKSNKQYEIQDILAIDHSENVIIINTLLFVSDMPVLYVRSYLPSKEYIFLKEETLSRYNDILDVIELEYKYIVKFVSEEFKIACFPKQIINKFNTHEDGLIRTRKTYRMDNAIIEYSESYLLNNNYSFKIKKERK